MTQALLFFVLMSLVNIECMETYSTSEMPAINYSPYKRIVEYNNQFNPKTKQTLVHRHAIDAIDARHKEHFTQKTFFELISEHEQECSAYIIAQVTTTIETEGKLGFQYDYYDAHALLKYLFGTNFLETHQHRYYTEIAEHKKNIWNLQPILGLIKFYKIDSVYDLEFNYIGSDYELYYQPTENITENLNNFFIYERLRQEFINDPLIIKAEKLTFTDVQKATRIFEKMIDPNSNLYWRIKYNLARLDWLLSDNEEKKQDALTKITEISNKTEQDPQTAKTASDFLISIFHESMEPSIFSDEQTT